MQSRPLTTLALALAFALGCTLMAGCNDESAPKTATPAPTPSADHQDHAGHDHADHADHAAPATKSAMGTHTGGVPADVVLVNTICPVSGEAFNRDDKTLSYFEHDGKNYGVCCSDCIALFKKNPEKYLAKLGAAQQKTKETVDGATNDATDAVKSVAPVVTQ